METFKGRPRVNSYPSPPDREILAEFKRPSKDYVLSRFNNNPEDSRCQNCVIQKKVICADNRR